MEKATPVSRGIKATVALTSWAIDGSGQVFSRPGFELDAGIVERLSFPLSTLEFTALESSIPDAGEFVAAGDELIPGLLEADYGLELQAVSIERRPDEDEVVVHFQWIRWVLDYNGFKVKGLGLKGSMMPWIRVGDHSTDPGALLPGIDLLVNLEAAKGSAITLAMFAEYREGGLDIGPDGLSPELQAEYQAWWDDHFQVHTVRHLVSRRMADYYEAAGHRILQLSDGWYVEQTAEFLVGTLTMEVEAPLVPHRMTWSSLSMAQGMLIAHDQLL